MVEDWFQLIVILVIGNVFLDNYYEICSGILCVFLLIFVALCLLTKWLRNDEETRHWDNNVLFDYLKKNKNLSHRKIFYKELPVHVQTYLKKHEFSEDRRKEKHIQAIILREELYGNRILFSIDFGNDELVTYTISWQEEDSPHPY